MKHNASEIIIRKANLADAKAIAHINSKTSKKIYRGVLPINFLEGLNPEKRLPTVLERIENPKLNCYVAFDSKTSEVVGFADFGPCRDRNSDADCELYAIYLSEDYFRSGIGQRLFAVGFDQMKKESYKKMMVSVFEKNTSARSFYERLKGNLDKSDCFVIEGTRYPTATYTWNLGENV